MNFASIAFRFPYENNQSVISQITIYGISNGLVRFMRRISEIRVSFANPN